MDNQIEMSPQDFPSLIDKKLYEKGWYCLWGEIDTDACSLCGGFLLNRMLRNCKESTIFICSEGGDEDDARALLSIIELCKSSGMIIRIYGAGLIASAALDIFITGSAGYRFAFEATMFMTHATSGHVADEEMYDLQKKFNVWILKQYTSIHPATIKKFMRTGNWWFGPQEAIGYGIMDAMIRPGDTLPKGPVLPIRKSAEQQKKEAQSNEDDK